MILSLYIRTFLLKIYFISFFYLNITYPGISLYNTNINDLFFRNFINDFFVNNYFYIWTSFWYVPFFLFYIFFCIKIISNVKYNIVYTLSFNLLLIVCFLDILDFNNSNPFSNFSEVNSYGVNPMLMNSINKYHPLMFYIPFSWVIFILSTFKLVINKKIYFTFFYKNNNLSKIKQNSNMIIVTLFMGSFWAIQEGSWGGWWNWDSSEVFGMVIMIFIYSLFHFKKKITYNTNYTYIVPILILIFYVFMQINFSLVSHNFGIKDSTGKININVYLVLLLLMFSNLISLWFKERLTITNSLILFFKKYFFFKKNYLLILFILIFLEIFYSISPLINDFIYNYLNFLSISFRGNFFKIVEYVFILSFLYFYKFNINYFLILSILITCSFDVFFLNTLLIMCFFVKNSKTYFIHYILLIFVYECIMSYFKNVIFFENINYVYTLDNFNNIFFYYNPIFSNSTDFLETSFLKTNNNKISYSDIRVFFNSTSNDTNGFSNYIINSVVIQKLLDNLISNLFLIPVFNTYLSNLITILFIILLSLYVFFSKKKLYNI